MLLHVDIYFHITDLYVLVSFQPSLAFFLSSPCSPDHGWSFFCYPTLIPLYSVPAAFSTAFGVAFNQISKQEFLNSALGLSSPALLTFAFWLLVVSLFLVAQNILIAIINAAYDRASKDECLSAEVCDEKSEP
jgi:hypothetical protein